MRWVRTAVAAGVAAAGLVAAGRLATSRLAYVLADRPTPLTPYKEPQWWLDYDAGFVRRGLPGEALTWLAGGSPDRGLVAAAGTATTLAAALAVVVVALRLARTAPSLDSRLLVAAVVLASPLTVTLLLHDVGRYDGIGVLALALLTVTAGWRGLPRWAATGAAALVLAAATAAQDLLLPVLAPAALARAGALPGPGPGPGGLPARLGLGTLVLAPGAAVGAGSALLPPPPGAVADARDAAVAAGVPRQSGWGDALDAVDRSLVENLSFFEFFGPEAVVSSALLWAGLYAATVVLLALLLGRSRDPVWWGVAAYAAACAVALSVLGVDFRRWWGLALLGLVAAAAITVPCARGTGARGGGPVLVVAVGALLAAGVWAGDLPVYPVVPVPRG